MKRVPEDGSSPGDAPGELLPPRPRVGLPYLQFGVRRQDERIDIFRFMETEPHWQTRLEAGIPLGTLLAEMHLKDRSAYQELRNRCEAIPAFLKAYPQNVASPELERLQTALASKPVTTTRMAQLERVTKFMTDFVSTQDPFGYRLGKWRPSPSLQPTVSS